MTVRRTERLRRRDPGPVARTALQPLAAVGQQVVIVGTGARQVPVGGGALLAVVDDPVVELQSAGRPTSRAGRTCSRHARGWRCAGPRGCDAGGEKPW